MIESNLKPLFKKVMIIDDTYVDRYVAERNIKKYLFADEVISTESVQNAMDYLTQSSGDVEKLPQLIFLDIRMPEKDGFCFLEEFDMLPYSIKKNCIIMMLSTSLNPDEHERARNNKYVSKFINKPLDKERLVIIKDDILSSKYMPVL